MVNAEKYGGRLDFTQRYMVGLGSGLYATMDHANEVTVYLYRDMDDMDSHFCHIYDRNLGRMTDGCLWKWAFYCDCMNPEDKESIWREWK